jgi:xylulokinase
VAIVDSQSGEMLGEADSPKGGMHTQSLRPGWAEQDPEEWWENLKLAVHGALEKSGKKGAEVKAIGITYQMHGLVAVDKKQKAVRPAIIWRDSRAVHLGERAFKGIGERHVLSRLLNSPGNFTAAKLAWVKENEPRLFGTIDKIMLPGDYIAMQMTGEVETTVSGLSEGIFWDFETNDLSEDILKYYGFDKRLIPKICSAFGSQGELTSWSAGELGLRKGIPVTYRAGDQPNNALSLNVLNPGEIAATAGTSGVVYGVNGKVNYDPLSRVNTFAHVNHTAEEPRLGVLLCINGVSILNSWIRRNVAPEGISYSDLNLMATSVAIGSEGVKVFPFGNGAERMLENKEINCTIDGINFNIHGRSHLARAAQEGVVFSFKYGMDIMNAMGIDIDVIRVSNANMFLSTLFRDTLAGITGAIIELYDTDGATGAAKGAGIGAGIYKDAKEAFSSLKCTGLVEPDGLRADAYCGAYEAWKEQLTQMLG